MPLLKENFQNLQSGEPRETDTASPSTSHEPKPIVSTPPTCYSWEIVPYNMGNVPISIEDPRTSEVPQTEEGFSKDELLEQLKEYKQKCDKHDREIFVSNVNIATIVLEHLNRRVNNRLISIHVNYSAMKEAINKFYIDKEVSIPLMETWIPRLQYLRIMAVGAKHDVNAVENSKPTVKTINGIQEFKGKIEPLEAKIRELLKFFHEMNHGILPSILKDDGNIKTLEDWRKETNEVISKQSTLIYQGNVMSMLKKNMDMLSHTGVFLEEFDKEENQLVTKYSPYRTKADEIIKFNWPIEEEFQV